MSVDKEGVRIVAAKGATCGDLSTSLSASSSNTDQKVDESIFSDPQDDRNDSMYPICFVDFRDGTTVLLVLFYVPIVSRRAGERERLMRRI